MRAIWSNRKDGRKAVFAQNAFTNDSIRSKFVRIEKKCIASQMLFRDSLMVRRLRHFYVRDFTVFIFAEYISRVTRVCAGIKLLWGNQKWYGKLKRTQREAARSVARNWEFAMRLNWRSRRYNSRYLTGGLFLYVNVYTYMFLCMCRYM